MRPSMARAASPPSARTVGMPACCWLPPCRRRSARPGPAAWNFAWPCAMRWSNCAKCPARMASSACPRPTTWAWTSVPGRWSRSKTAPGNTSPEPSGHGFADCPAVGARRPGQWRHLRTDGAGPGAGFFRDPGDLHPPGRLRGLWRADHGHAARGGHSAPAVAAAGSGRCGAGGGTAAPHRRPRRPLAEHPAVVRGVAAAGLRAGVAAGPAPGAGVGPAPGSVGTGPAPGVVVPARADHAGADRPAGPAAVPPGFSAAGRCLGADAAHRRGGAARRAGGAGPAVLRRRGGAHASVCRGPLGVRRHGHFGPGAGGAGRHPGAAGAGAGAGVMGIAAERSAELSFALAALIGAVSGLLIAPLTTVYYDTGFLIGLKGFVAAIVGALASYPLALAGALLVGQLEAFASFWASAYKEVLVFTLIVPVLWWRSLGSRLVEDEE